MNSEPYPYPVEFTGNGVIAQGKFYPYKFVNTGTTYAQLDTIRNGFLAIRDLHLVAWQSAATAAQTCLFEGYKEGQSQYVHAVAALASTVQVINHEYRLDSVFDRGKSLTWTVAPSPFVSIGVIFKYAEIDILVETNIQKAEQAFQDSCQPYTVERLLGWCDK